MSDYLFEGPIQEYTVEELVQGFQATSITDKLNTGTVQEGNIWYRPLVTPLYLNQDPDYATASYNSVDTGESVENDVGVIQLMNDKTW